MSLEEEEENKKVKNDEISVKTENIEEIENYWQVSIRRSRGGLTKSVFDKLSEFGVIQNVRGDGNCGIYSIMEGLLNCLIPVVTDVIAFRKEVCDFIDKNRNEVLSNFSFAGKILKSGKMRGKKRDDWIEKDVMARMWEEEAKFLPTSDEFHYVDAN